MPIQSTGRGQKIIIEPPAPDAGADIPNKNKSKPDSMGGGPHDLSRTLTGGAKSAKGKESY